MALIELDMQDWNASFAYAPPLRKVVVNTEQIASARETESRGSGPWTRLTLTTGEAMTVQGTPADIATKARA